VLNGFRDPERLPWVRRFYGTMRHSAETAVAGAAVAQDEKRRCALRKAFAQVGTARFLAHRVKVRFLDEPAYFLIGGPARYSPLEPGRFG